ncbi:MAG TPA: LysE family transporter [Candidatus Babeliales bacterium]|nr:LysE family transporter [Candidatus Babeliales bacterium]
MNELLIILLKGLLFGLTIAVIPGPSFFMIVQRTLHTGTLAGLLAALGAITADVIYATLALLGLSAITNFLLAYLNLIELGGGLFLIYLGWLIWVRVVQQTTPRPVQARGLINAWLATFLLTLTNPATIISYAIIFAGMQLNLNLGWEGYLAFITGLLSGATSIELGLIGLLHYQRHRLSLRTLTLINKVAGAVFFLLGSVALLRGLQAYL